MIQGWETHGRQALALLAVLAGLAVGALGLPSSSAAATNVPYCAVWVNPHTRCPDEVARHSYNTNSVEGFSYTLSAEQNWYDTKCERMTAWDDYSVIFSRICNSHRVTTGRWDDFCGNCEQYENAGVLLKVYAGNDAPRNQKIYGNGVY